MKLFPNFFSSFMKKFLRPSVTPKYNSYNSTKFSLKIAKTKRRFLAYSPEFKDFIKQHKKILMPALKLIRENLGKMGGGQIIKEQGIQIQRFTEKTLVVKVNVVEKEFFVKKLKPTVDIPELAKNILKGTRIVENYLRKRKYKLGSFNAYVIKPHLLYERFPAEGRYGYLVTDFYNEGEIKNAWGLSGAKGTEIYKVLSKLEEDLPTLLDLKTHNAFYEQRTNTILLFDIECRY